MNFKVKDTVVCNILGVGTVEAIVPYEGRSCLKVKFQNGEWDLYELNGQPLKAMNEQDTGLRSIHEHQTL